MSCTKTACKDVVPPGQEELWETVCSLSASDVAAHPCLKQMHAVFEYYLKYPTTSLEKHVVCTMQEAWLTYPDTVSPSMDAVEDVIDAVFAIAAELYLFYLVSFHKDPVKKPVLRHIVDLFLVVYIKTRREALQGSTPDDIRVVMATCEAELEVMAELYRDLFDEKSGKALSMAYCRLNPTGAQWDDCDGTRWVIVELARMILSGWVMKQPKV